MQARGFARHVDQDRVDDRFQETNRFRYFTSGSDPGSRALARVLKPSPEDFPPSLRGALATKQSIVRRTRLWIASLTGRRLAPSRWLAMTVDGTDMFRTSKSLNQGASGSPRSYERGRDEGQAVRGASGSSRFNQKPSCSGVIIATNPEKTLCVNRDSGSRLSSEPGAICSPPPDR
jgi:hypothetical protein